MRNTVLVQTNNVLSVFGYADGWCNDKHVRLVADTTGDGNKDIVGFGEGGLYVSTSNGNNTWNSANLVLNTFGYQDGWRVDKHIRYMVDLRKTGRADVVGFGEGGVYVSLNNGGGIFKTPILALNDFGVASGWSLDKHLRFLADVTGDGLPDIVGFGDRNVFISKNNGDGTFAVPNPVLSVFCVGDGWDIKKHVRTLADMTGSGSVDIVGFGDPGVYISYNNGNGTFQPPKLVISDFGYVSGNWRVEKHVRFVADLTGDGRGDIVGFGDGGVYVSYNKGNGTFSASVLVINNFGYVNGWRVEKHIRFAVDLTGDGCADIIGFGDDAVYVAYNDGKGGFGPVQKLVNSTFSYNSGWTKDQTVRWVANLF